MQDLKLNLRQINLSETVELIKSVGNSKSFGQDELDGTTIKMIAPSVYRPIQHLINLSIKNSTFASRWKIGRLIPLHKGKKKDRHQTDSYRPISLLPLVVKLAERAVQQQTLKFMETTLQLNHNNNAYRKHYSTATALIQVTDAIHQATDARSIANVITVDETSAFDMISHEILHRKIPTVQFQ